LRSGVQGPRAAERLHRAGAAPPSPGSQAQVRHRLSVGSGAPFPAPRGAVFCGSAQVGVPRMTLEALKTAVAGLPSASSSASLLSLVMMAAIEPPPGRAMTTSVLTAPACRRVTVPVSRLRAESLAA